jgi:hypothetical protein
MAAFAATLQPVPVIVKETPVTSKESAQWAVYHGVPEGLSATDPRFRGVVMLLWQDSSQAVFQNAFFVEAREEGNLVVFTEHCGYHKFSLAGLRHYCCV